MNNITLDSLLVGVPESVANMQLPDPNLRDFYRDEVDRTYWLNDVVGEDTLDIVKMIIKCNQEDKDKSAAERKPIKIMIDSPGGKVQTMYAVIKAIEMSKTPVYTIVYCNAMSAAAEILAAGHKRYAMPGTCVMVHSGGVGYGGTMEQVESQKKYTDALIKRSTETFLKNTKIDAKTLKKKGASDWFMDEEEALERGIVDEIVTDLDLVF